MGRFDVPLYDDPRKWIQKKNEKQVPWSKIRLVCKSDVQASEKFLVPVRKKMTGYGCLQMIRMN